VRTDDREAYEEVLHRVRARAFPAGEFVGQESFVGAGEVLALARRAGIGPGVGVLDVCCGVAGPGRLVARELGCDYLGVDASAEAVSVARARAEGLPCRFEVATVPPLPTGPFDVVLLLETLLAFRDKAPLLEAVAEALLPGGRFAFTVEVGAPLTDVERRRMPSADTVWPVPLPSLVDGLARAGLTVRWHEDHTVEHRTVVDGLLAAYDDASEPIAARLGAGVVDGLLTSHRLWRDWLGSGRVRKLAVLAVKS
jgi:SAM-dependent methyltransferase